MFEWTRLKQCFYLTNLIHLYTHLTNEDLHLRVQQSANACIQDELHYDLYYIILQSKQLKVKDLAQKPNSDHLAVVGLNPSFSGLLDWYPKLWPTAYPCCKRE